MQFKKGNKAGQGRKKGSVNRATKEVREAFNLLLDNNLDNIQEHLDNIAGQNSVKYIELVLKLAEYTIPKISPTQVINHMDGTQYKVEFSE